MWHCAFKFDFDYYALVDEDGVQLKTAFKENELITSEGQKIIKLKYDGCPRHAQQSTENKTDDDFGF